MTLNDWLEGLKPELASFGVRASWQSETSKVHHLLLRGRNTEELVSACTFAMNKFHGVFGAMPVLCGNLGTLEMTMICGDHESRQ